jgi:hypothetical protein
MMPNLRATLPQERRPHPIIYIQSQWYEDYLQLSPVMN